MSMYPKTCRLCLDSHDRDDVFCSTCRRFADWWNGLSPDECRQHEQLIGDSVDVLLPRTSRPVKTLTSGRPRSHAPPEPILRGRRPCSSTGLSPR